METSCLGKFTGVALRASGCFDDCRQGHSVAIPPKTLAGQLRYSSRHPLLPPSTASLSVSWLCSAERPSRLVLGETVARVHLGGMVSGSALSEKPQVADRSVMALFPWAIACRNFPPRSLGFKKRVHPTVLSCDIPSTCLSGQGLFGGRLIALKRRERRSEAVRLPRLTTGC